MDQDPNNPYPNNNETPNNQPLDNQGMDNVPNQDTAPDNNPVQPQSTQDYQQPVDQPVTPDPVPQPTSQPTQSFEPPINQPNVPEPIPQPAPQPIPQPTPQPMQQDFNQPPKKKKTGLIIGIVVAIIILAVGAVFLIRHFRKDKVAKDVNDILQQSTATATIDDIVNNITQPSKPAETKKEDDKRPVFNYSYKVPGKKIFIDVPNYQVIDNGYTQLYIVNGERYVAITAAKKSTATELSAGHADAFEKFKANIQNSSLVNSLSVTTDSIETINGVEVYKYEGTLNCGIDTVYDAYVIGYSFIMDGVPCTITGSVINMDQPEDMIAEIKYVVETMIKTLRSER